MNNNTQHNQRYIDTVDDVEYYTHDDDMKMMMTMDVDIN